MRDYAPTAVAGDTCVACRFNLPNDARFCPRCGVAIGTEFVSLTASRSGAGASDAERSGRRPSALGVMAALGILIVGGLAIVDRTTRPAPAPEPPTTVEPTTTSTTATPTTSTPADPAESVSVSLATQPVPSVPGLYLLVLLRDGRVAEIDMETGAAHAFVVDSEMRVSADFGAIAVLDDGMLVNLSDQLYALPNGSSEVRSIATSREIVSTGQRYALAFDLSPDSGGVPVPVLIDGNGAESPSPEIHEMNGHWPWWAAQLTADDRLAVNRAERIGIVDPTTGQANELGEGVLLARGPNHVLLHTCDRAGVCSVELASLAGERRAVEVELSPDWFGSMRLSPDGQWAVGAQWGDPTTREIVNLMTGQRMELPAVLGPPWRQMASFSSDSRFLAVVAGSTVELWDLSAGSNIATLNDLGSPIAASFSTRPSGR